MRRILAITTALLALAPALGAQLPAPVPGHVDLRPFVGVYVPTGAMADDFGSTNVLGAQVAIELSRDWHLVGSLLWARADNAFGLDDDATHVVQYDVGAELGHERPLGAFWTVRPFLGFGAGGRTYDYMASDVGVDSCTAGYGAIGAEARQGTFGIRVEARDYLSCFESPLSGEKRTRSDVTVGVGLTIHFSEL